MKTAVGFSKVLPKSFPPGGKVIAKKSWGLRLTALMIIFLLQLSLLPPGTAAAAGSAVLPVRQGVTAGQEGTAFVVRWENPAGILEFVRSHSGSFGGSLNYLIDWRVNGGTWHYDREFPEGQDVLDFYPDIPAGFHGAVFDQGKSVC